MEQRFRGAVRKAEGVSVLNGAESLLGMMQKLLGVDGGDSRSHRECTQCLSAVFLQKAEMINPT